MEIGAIITLTLLGVALAVFGIVLAVRGGKIKFPEGQRYSVKSGKFKLHLVVHKDADLLCDYSAHEYAMFCLNILKVMYYQFAGQTSLCNKEVLDKCREVIVYIMPNKAFNVMGGQKYLEHYQHAAAVNSKRGRYFWGKDVPCACIRDRYVQKILKFGEPLVHELCHAFLDDYVADSTDHVNPSVWIQAGDELTVQYRAQRIIEEWNGNVL
jgi:hypothetical protein